MGNNHETNKLHVEDIRTMQMNFVFLNCNKCKHRIQNSTDKHLYIGNASASSM